MGQGRRWRKNLCGALGRDNKAGGRRESDVEGKYIWRKEATPVGEEEEEGD